jgi:hypothetical protein
MFFKITVSHSIMIRGKQALVVYILMTVLCPLIESKALVRALRVKGITPNEQKNTATKIQRRAAGAEKYGASIVERPASRDKKIDIEEEYREKQGGAKASGARIAEQPAYRGPTLEGEEEYVLPDGHAISSPQESKVFGDDNVVTKQSYDKSKEGSHMISSNGSKKSHHHSTIAKHKKSVSMDKAPLGFQHQDVVDETDRDYKQQQEADKKLRNKPQAKQEKEKSE